MQPRALTSIRPIIPPLTESRQTQQLRVTKSIIRAPAIINRPKGKEERTVAQGIFDFLKSYREYPHA